VCAVLQTAFYACRHKIGGYHAAPEPLRYITASIIPHENNACRYVHITASQRRFNLMAIYHCSIKIVTRGKGKSAVAAAAYRAAEKIKNDYDNEIHDYRRKRDVICKMIMLPENAPPEYKDRAVLWNAVEKVEKNSNSQLAREIELALPKEFGNALNLLLVKNYVQEQFVNKGMCADICIHDKNGENPHAHILLTMRPFEQDGSWGAKSKKEYILDRHGEKIRLPSGEFKTRKITTTDWDNKDKAEEWRKAWAEIVNECFERRKSETRVDHRSYKRQGKEEIPTVHLGVAAFQMERRGIHTERGNINRNIEVTNQRLRAIKARIRRLQDWLKDEAVNTEPPTLYNIVSEILNRDGNKLYNLRDGARVLCFLQENDIKDLQSLENKLRSMVSKQLAVGNDLKPVNKRLKTLDEHFTQSDNFKQNRKYKLHYDKLYAEYKTLKKSTGFMAKHKANKALAAANAYRERYSREINLYNKAEQYLKDKLQKHFDPKNLPIKKWKAEQTELLSKKSALNGEYAKLKEEVREVEIMRNTVERIVRSDRPQQRTRAQGMEL